MLLACEAPPVDPPTPFAPEPDVTDGFLSSPFEGTASAITFFDHNWKETGAPRSAWGGALVPTPNASGHLGYDWYMPEGTQVFAAGDGTVSFSGIRKPFWCDLLGKQVADQRAVLIRHETADGRKWETSYDHLSEAYVAKGDIVTAGDVLGASGDGGCSTGPHLHFVVKRVERDETGQRRRVRVDPYGWDGPGPDPSEGANEWLWQPEEAPILLRFNLGADALSSVQFLASTGWDDARHPNNERLVLRMPFWETPRDCVIRNNRGEEYPLPAPTLLGSQSLSVYSGSGMSARGVHFLGRDVGLWDDVGDCVHLICGGEEVAEHAAHAATCSHVAWGAEIGARGN